jgi:hypothetical protein
MAGCRGRLDKLLRWNMRIAVLEKSSIAAI